MNKKKLIGFLTGGVAIALIAIVAIAADHMDAPNVTGEPSDIADLYAFESPENADNTTLIATLPIAAATNADDATFSEDVMIEFNIDNTGDFEEDLVIQATPRDGKMYFFGPYPPAQPGLSSSIDESANQNSVDISNSANVIVGENTGNGMSFYAGPRKDYFFFDFNQFNEVISGNAPNGFNQEADAVDAFAEANVLVIAVDVPNDMLGAPAVHVGNTLDGVSGLPDVYNIWVTSNRVQ
jgi:hypothetical protein